MSVNQLNYYRITMIALKFALIAMLISISSDLIVQDTEGTLKEMINMISFVFLYSIFVFYTINTIKQENDNVLTFKDAFFGGGLYILFTGIIYAIFLTFIKGFDMEKLEEGMRLVWEQNQIPEEDIQLLLEQLNNSTIFTGILFIHIAFGLFSVLLICVFAFFSPFKKRTN